MAVRSSMLGYAILFTAIGPTPCPASPPGRYSWPVPFCWRRGKVFMHLADSDRAFAHCGCHPFNRAVPDIADGERPRQAGLEQEGSPFQWPALPGVRAGEDESRSVSADLLREPVGERFGADQDEQACGRHRLYPAGALVEQVQVLE